MSNDELIDDSWLEVPIFPHEHSSSNSEPVIHPPGASHEMHAEFSPHIMERFLRRAQNLTPSHSSPSAVSSSRSSTKGDNGGINSKIPQFLSTLQETIPWDVNAFGERDSRPDGLYSMLLLKPSSPIELLRPSNRSSRWSNSGASFDINEFESGQAKRASFTAYLVEHLHSLLVSHAFSFLLGAAGMLLLLKFASN